MKLPARAATSLLVRVNNAPGGLAIYSSPSFSQLRFFNDNPDGMNHKFELKEVWIGRWYGIRGSRPHQQFQPRYDWREVCIKCGMHELKIKDDPTNESKRCSVSDKEYQDREEKEKTES